MASQISKIIKSDTPPINTRTLWLDTKSNQLKSFTPSGWNYVGSDLSKYAKTSEINTFIQNQIFTDGITFNSHTSGGPRFINSDAMTIKATLYNSNNAYAYIEAASASQGSPSNCVLTVDSLTQYPWQVFNSWTFSAYPTMPGIMFEDEACMYASYEANTSYLDVYSRKSGRDGVAFKGISKVLDDKTSVTNKEYVDNLISSLQETINALTQRIANLEAPANNS